MEEKKKAPSREEAGYEALRHYSAYGKNEGYIVGQISTICEIMNVLGLPEYKKNT